MILTENGVLKLMQRIKSFITAQLNTKASSVHTHSISEIDNLASQLGGGGYTKSESDDKFVDKTSNQTVGGQKIFTHGATGLGRDSHHFATIPYGKNTPPANTSFQYVFFSGNSASQGFTNSWYGGYLEQVMFIDGSARGRWQVRRTDETFASVEILAALDDTLTFRPTYNNQMQLGDSTRAWKDCKTNAINGIDPSTLSFPNKSSYINIDTTNWDLTCSDNGLMVNYVVEQSGWLLLQIAHGSTDIVDLWAITDSIRMSNKSTFNTLNNANFNMISLPVVKGGTLKIYGDASQYVAGRAINYARIYTGLGA